MSTAVTSNVRASNERLHGLCCASRCSRTGTTVVDLVLGGRPRPVAMCVEHAARYGASAF
jgi:hypothetical protein